MFVLGGMWLAAIAAAQTPSAEQLEIFSSLTPEQQQALLEGLATSQGASTPPESGAERPEEAESNAARRRIAEQSEREREPETPVMRPEDTVLVEPAVPGAGATQLTPTERTSLTRLAELIRQRNPYQLDRNGQLHLPGVAPIALRGLNEQQATQRLSLEPALLNLQVRLTRLPLDNAGVAGLKPFGYDLFDNAPSTFAPVTNVPVPADYIVGPGDELNVQLYGSQNRSVPLTVSRDGIVNFPQLGPINVGGMRFDAARRAIETRVSQQMIGVEASVSMGTTRSIRVIVSGDARLPGSYTVDGLATVISALYASGGVKEIGSLRNIQLLRQGTLVHTLDLYDLLLRGDTRDDARLLPGDVIFIPPVGATVAVDGEVRRPAVYELRGETSVADVVRMAGGLTAEADASRATLTRIDASSRRVVDNVNLAQPSGSGQVVGNGNVLRIARLRPQIDLGVEIEGFVHRSGPVAWREGLRLTDVIGSVDELKPNADLHYVLIRRESGPDRRIDGLSVDLVAALAAPGTAADVALMPRDRITVFELAPGRERIIRPLLDELRLQSGVTRPTDVVGIGGRVKAPGEFPLEPGMRVSDLLRAGGGLDASAFGAEAELTRYTLNEAGERRTELIVVDLAGIRSGEAAADIPLRSDDFLTVKETPDWSERESITLRGEVRFPGTYPIRRGETLRQVLDRAGGLTALAFPQGSVFTRRDLRELEQQQIDGYTERIRSELASLALQAANAGQASAVEALQSGQALLAQLQGAKATGRFVIDLPALLDDGSGGEQDVLLRDGDELIIPKLRQEVSVIGEVQNATSHLYRPRLKRNDYISMSGGTTRKADDGRIYIVRADGSVATQGGSWLSRNYDLAVKPGDTIVVPLDTERMPRLPFWQAVTQILYNVAVSVAAINSF
jgi:protein involved in polysaccharide export with SLBB domain